MPFNPPNKTKVLNVALGQAPYGSWFNPGTGQREYYDINGDYYVNVAAINVLQDIFTEDANELGV